MNNGTTRAQGGIGLPVILTLIFVVLKLTGFIGWSWWWVLSPLWIAFGLWLIVLAVVALVGVGIIVSGDKRR